MKCIKCIKEAKSYTLGEIRRVKDNEAEERVNAGYWKYVTKTEWRTSKGIVKGEVKYSSEVNEAATVSLNTAVEYQNESNNKKSK